MTRLRTALPLKAPALIVFLYLATPGCGSDPKDSNTASGGAGVGGSSGAAGTSGGVGGTSVAGAGAGGAAGLGGSSGMHTGGATSGGSAGIGGAGGASVGGTSPGGTGGTSAGGASAGGTGGTSAGGSGGTGGAACLVPGITAVASDWELAATDPGAANGNRPALLDFDADACGTPYLTYELGGVILVSRWGANGFEVLGDSSATYPFTDAASAKLDIGDDGKPVIAWNKAGDVGAAQWDGSTWVSLGSSVGTGGLRGVIALGATPVVLTSAGTYEDITISAHRWDGSAWKDMGLQPVVGPLIDVGVAATRDSQGRAIISYSQALYSGGRQMAESTIRWDGSAWVPLGPAHGSEWYQPGEIEWIDVVAAGDAPVTSDGLTGITRWNGVDWVSYPDLPRGPFALAVDSDGSPLVLKQAKFTGTSTVGQLKVLRMDSGNWTQLGSLIADGILANNYNSSAYPYVVKLEIASGEKARWVALQSGTELVIKAWGL